MMRSVRFAGNGRMYIGSMIIDEARRWTKSRTDVLIHVNGVSSPQRTMANTGSTGICAK